MPSDRTPRVLPDPPTDHAPDGPDATEQEHADEIVRGGLADGWTPEVIVEHQVRRQAAARHNQPALLDTAPTLDYWGEPITQDRMDETLRAMGWIE